MIMELLNVYKNGNYTVRIYDDGTKERFTLEDDFHAAFPESIDLKITQQCDLLCPMCHEESTPDGEHANLDAPFLSTLRAGTELAIGGGNPLSHPDLIPFLKRMKEQGVLCNMTVNERHLLQSKGVIKNLLDEKLIWGLGVSLNLYSPKTFAFCASYPNTVYHVILGLIKQEQFRLIPKNAKVLFLGYKKFGRGAGYFSPEIEERIQRTERSFRALTSHLKAVAFDNLALTQLHVQKHVPPNVYRRFYMGDDGSATMYVDLVKKQCAISSTSTVRFPLKDTIDAMFASIQA